MLVLLSFAAFFLLLGLMYVIVSLMAVPGLAEERLGVPEELANLNEWRDDAESDAGRAAAADGLLRQERLWVDPGRDLLGRERILRQVRYLDATTGELVRTEPDRRIRRRRVRRR